ncbi:M17 family metallopeptidase [Nocardioides sp. B-3]|uniref:M17 family metallopeptidase n=1 Tax=Nocardioides sp. B-3 TaxID=2895565 RepID=UPI003FA5EA75
MLAGTTDEDADDELARALAAGGAGWRSRFLASVPSNLKTPAWLAEQAEELAAAAGLDVTIWDEKKLAEEGFGGVLAVGAASVSPPRLIRLDYSPADATKKTPTVVLVGKGITFDTGGLDIKPPAGMLSMKRDMSGGAAVLATMAALRDVQCPVRVIGLVPAAENAVGGAAMRPGDVIRHYGGRTSEVNNTDAEGRLVMADAMAYAVAELKPDIPVDVATLTGAMKVALGQGTGGYFANNEAPADLLADASATSGELLWRMPLVADYEERVSSKVADGDNSSGGARGHHRGLVPPALHGRRPVGAHRLRLHRRSPGRALRVDAGADRLRSPGPSRVARLGRPPPRGRAMKGLTVRWSLAGAAEGIEESLAAYVADTSFALHRHDRAPVQDVARGSGDWFEGYYVFASDDARRIPGRPSPPAPPSHRSPCSSARPRS